MLTDAELRWLQKRQPKFPRQDSDIDQLKDLAEIARWMKCYDAVEIINRITYESDTRFYDNSKV
jgi:hypothetical protein